jgi:predicted dienelactone hydrolase
MEALLFLLIAFVLIALGTTVVLLRAREPKGEYQGIKSFQKEMQALAPTPAEGIERPAGVDPLLYEMSQAAKADESMDAQPAEHQE